MNAASSEFTWFRILFRLSRFQCYVGIYLLHIYSVKPWVKSLILPSMHRTLTVSVSLLGWFTWFCHLVRVVSDKQNSPTNCLFTFSWKHKFAVCNVGVQFLTRHRMCFGVMQTQGILRVDTGAENSVALAFYNDLKRSSQILKFCVLRLIWVGVIRWNDSKSLAILHALNCRYETKPSFIIHDLYLCHKKGFCLQLQSPANNPKSVNHAGHRVLVIKLDQCTHRDWVVLDTFFWERPE